MVRVFVLCNYSFYFLSFLNEIIKSILQEQIRAEQSKNKFNLSGLEVADFRDADGEDGKAIKMLDNLSVVAGYFFLKKFDFPVDFAAELQNYCTKALGLLRPAAAHAASESKSDSSNSVL